ncbi:MAG: HlyC/CorC family transporter [Solobacterium sp.]|nr:HlyC/CorC family transporter [Solobacterium sp.]
MNLLYACILAAALCVAASAFFSASEMSYSSCNRIRIENQAEEGDEKAKAALKITENFDNALSAILVGNNLVNIAASSLGSVAAILALGEDYTWVSTVVITTAVIIFGETIPKITAKKNATRYALSFSGITRFLMIVLRPVTWIVVSLVDLITSGMKGEEVQDEDAAVEELHSIIETAEDENVIDEDSSELISAAIDFADISAFEAMTARVDILAIDIDDSWDEIMETIESSAFSRIPVYEDSIDNVIGILSLNHFLKASIDDRNVDLRGLLMQPLFVYKTMKLPAVLTLLRDSQQHLAIVTDEYGGTLGVITMEDVLEELVGDIWDETDKVEEEIRVVDDGLFLIDGDTPVHELCELMDWDETIFDFESETVGGWCIEMLESFPQEGENFTFRNTEVTVKEVDERRVKLVEVRLKEEQN